MGKNKRRFGDRKEGRRVRSLHPMDYVAPFIMVQRNDASNLFRDEFDIEEAEKYVQKKRAEGLKNFGLMHVLMAAYVRTVSQKPGVNRFLGGQKIYARNDIVVNIMVKKSLALNAEETALKIFFEPTDTATDVYNRFQASYEEALNSDDRGFETAAKIVNMIPGILKRFFVWILKIFDYFDLLPRSLTNISPFHGSLFITSMGSLGIPPVFHHLYNFGNVPIFLAFGSKRTAYKLDKDGNARKKIYVDVSVTTDERICDGYYYASTFRTIKSCVKHPEVLDNPPQKVVADID